MLEDKISEDKQWLDLTIPKIAENIGSYKKDTRYNLLKVESRLMSDMYFVRMYSTNKVNKVREMRLMVIKKNKVFEIMDVKSQFHNEIMFYRMFYQQGENFPTYFYSYDPLPNSTDYSIIALEDVSKNGFVGCPVSHDPPYNYILAAMRELGRFHAKGYVLKEKDQTKFYSIVDKIQEIRYNKTENQRFGQFINITSTRAVEYLRERGYDANFCDKTEALLSNAHEKVMIPIVTVTESSKLLSTICHGDTTLDNMLFQPQGNGHFNAMLIDFGMIRYGTPVIDLSTFFCLTCTNNMMRDKLHDILTVYHTALTNYMSLEGVTNTKKYSYNAILNDYKEGCLFGFVIASFYLIHSLEDFNPSGSEENPQIRNVEQMAKMHKENGGESVSAILAEMLLQMVEFGCLERFS